MLVCQTMIRSFGYSTNILAIDVVLRPGPLSPQQNYNNTEPAPPLPPTQWQPKRDDIRTEYHEKSGRPEEFSSFETYQRRTTELPPVTNERPWLPFHSESEFTFAEIALQAALSNKQLDNLIAVIHKLMGGQEQFAVKNHGDIEKLWSQASEDYAPVS